MLHCLRSAMFMQYLTGCFIIFFLSCSLFSSITSKNKPEVNVVTSDAMTELRVSVVTSNTMPELKVNTTTSDTMPELRPDLHIALLPSNQAPQWAGSVTPMSWSVSVLRRWRLTQGPKKEKIPENDSPGSEVQMNKPDILLLSTSWDVQNSLRFPKTCPKKKNLWKNRSYRTSDCWRTFINNLNLEPRALWENYKESTRFRSERQTGEH